MHSLIILSWLWISFLLLAGCSSQQHTAVSPDSHTLPSTTAPHPAASLTPFQPATHTPVPTSTPEPDFTFWLDPAAPNLLKNSLHLPEEMQAVSDLSQAAFRLQTSGRDYENLTELESVTWVYALVAPFSTIQDGITWDQLKATWQGNMVAELEMLPLLMEQSTLLAIESIIGVPAPEVVQVLASERLVEAAWENRSSWAIIPFENVEPRWKVMAIDGESPINKDFDKAIYPLQVTFSLMGLPQWEQSFRATISQQDIVSAVPGQNWDVLQMTDVLMTGVTALVRATAWRMDVNGVTYPGQDIRNILQEADIAHISNEVSFAENCPTANPVSESLRFCSKPEYIELLVDIGADVIELTGNHATDWGREAMAYSLELYRQRGFQFFAGGNTSEEARRPLIIEHNGNRLAFMGCNPAGPPSSWATENEPGSASCDYDWMHAQIRDLRSQGILPIVTFQYNESYTSFPGNAQMMDFRSMAEAGAVIVSGSQAHYPQAMEFKGDGFIHYGLGNLFFDQQNFIDLGSGVLVEGTRWEFADRHVFYQGKHISTELLTFMLEDWSKPRPMTLEERRSLLSIIFEASGW